MRADVVLYDFGRQARHSGACAGEQVHDRLTASLAFQSPFYCFDLPANAAHSGQELLLLTDRMRHGSVIA